MADRLKKYREMRDFAVTPEPAGGTPKGGKLPIFVIQKHHASHLHYDFRLEMEGVLKSWAIPKGPSYDPDTKRLAMMTEDHPYDYASFEGVIPAGNYGGGNVIIWDQGGWEFIEPGDDPVKALHAGKLTFRMFGKKMFGEWALVKIHGRSPRGNEWLLLKHRDEFAAPNFDITVVAPLSVVSNRDVEDVASDRIWQSNRGASLTGKSAPTIASALAKQEKEKKQKTASRKRATAKKRATPSAASGSATKSRTANTARTPSKAAASRKAAKPASRARTAKPPAPEAAAAKASKRSNGASRKAPAKPASREKTSSARRRSE